MNVIKVEDIEAMITCPMCDKVLSAPSTFRCFHSFCKTCISKFKYVKVNETIGYNCPECRCFTAESAIKTNFLVYKLVDIYKKAKNGVLDTCTFCEQSASHKCNECKVKLCNDCPERIHNKFPGNERHHLQGLDTGTQEAVIDDIIFCEEHSDKKLEVHCKTCEKPICVLCKITSHQKHDAETVEDALKYLVPDLKNSRESLEIWIKDAKTVINTYEEASKSFLTAIQTLQGQLDKQKKTLLEQIEENYKTLCTFLSAEQARVQRELAAMSSQVESYIKQHENVITWVDTTLTTATDVSLLKEIQDGLRNTVHKRTTSSPILPDINSVHPIDFTFLPSRYFGACGDNIIGEFVHRNNVPDVKSIVDHVHQYKNHVTCQNERLLVCALSDDNYVYTELKETGERWIAYKNVLVLVKVGKNKNGTESVIDASGAKRNFSFLGERPKIIHFRDNNEHGIERIFEEDYDHSFDHSEDAGKFWAIKEIILFDSTILSTGMVASVSGNELAFTTGNALYVIDRCNKTMKLVQKGLFRYVVFYNETLFAAGQIEGPYVALVNIEGVWKKKETESKPLYGVGLYIRPNSVK